MSHAGFDTVILNRGMAALAVMFLALTLKANKLHYVQILFVHWSHKKRKYLQEATWFWYQIVNTFICDLMLYIYFKRHILITPKEPAPIYSQHAFTLGTIALYSVRAQLLLLCLLVPGHTCVCTPSSTVGGDMLVCAQPRQETSCATYLCSLQFIVSLHWCITLSSLYDCACCCSL